MRKFLMFALMLSICFLSGCNKSGESSDVAISSSENNSSIIENNLNNESKKSITINTIDAKYEGTTLMEAIDFVYDSAVVIEAKNETSSGAGSGVFFAYDENFSYIITCHHVIDLMTDIDIVLNNGERLDASLIGGDPKSDIAVLGVEVGDYRYAPICSDFSNVKLGSSVFAIGNPLGELGGSVTDGIISATSRSITMSDGNVMSLMQTNAAINSGNSGGGLFSFEGELIGIVNAKYAKTGVEGLGFAIPITDATDVAYELIEKGYVEGRFDLGITFANSMSFFNGYTLYTYDVSKSGSAYGLVSKNEIVNSISVRYADGTTSSVLKGGGNSASNVYTFLNECNLKIGDTVILEIQTNNTIKVVEVLIKQYKYVV